MAIEGIYIQGQNVTHLMTYILSRVACCNAYTNWSDEFCRKETKNAYNRAIDEIKKIDFSQITESEAEILGFRRFSSESYLYLVPLWLYEALPDGTELISIMGDKAVKGKDYIDNDVRFGCLGYGMIIRGKEEAYKSDDTIRLDEMEDENV